MHTQTEAEADRVAFRALAGLVGFKLESFGGNTVAYVRRGRAYVDVLTADGDSFPPETGADRALLLRHTVESFATWEADGADDGADVVATYTGPARHLLAID